ncbi:MAG: hypothetical protein RMJ15_00120 [Nitrososphaerota archaeon]|nr:hypothetical protein [Candidatus Bathyarchaeota archaeon]MDW8022141.1 hypothetical protein [Nitrososphaerota archaeon]
MAEKRRFLRFFCDGRAITPVLSNLLLMVVAVAAMSIAATATYVITTNLRETMGERLIIEDVWFRNPNQISVYVRNIGKVEMQISAVYINNTRQPSSTLRLDVGEHGWLHIPYNWVSGRPYHIKIVTSRGTQVGGYYKAP